MSKRQRPLPPAIEQEVRAVLRRAGRRILSERRKAAQPASLRPPAGTVKT